MRVSLKKRTTYEGNLSSDIDDLVAHIGGFGSFVSPGDRVLIKPNLVRANPLNNCTCTDPEFVSAVCRILLDHGCRVSVGDSPMIGSARGVSASLGLDRKLERLGVPIIEFTRNVPYPRPEEIRKRRSAPQLLARELQDFDKIINLPKLKSHVQTGVTLAVKNLYGCVAGEKKKLLHLTAGDSGRFSRMLLEVAYTAHPCLSILDGITGMDLNGPCSGRPLNTGIMIASADCLALDLTTVELLALRPSGIGVLKEASKVLTRPPDIRDIEILGDNPESCRVDHFISIHLWPVDFAGFHFLYRPLMKALGKRITIDAAVCTRCRTCQGVCPAGALRLTAVGMEVSRRRCIRCCCCIEACPARAVSLKNPFSV